MYYKYSLRCQTFKCGASPSAGNLLDSGTGHVAFALYYLMVTTVNLLSPAPQKRMSYQLLPIGIVCCTVLMGVSVTAASGTSKLPTTPPRSSYFKPPCDLQALNNEYAVALMYKRRVASPLAPEVHFDGNMLAGTVLHNQRMAEQDSLFHDYLSFHAELVGTLIDIEEFRDNPRKLARYIWTRFDKSPHHAVIQRNASLCYVSVSCSSRYFVVRLDDHPSTRNTPQAESYRQWELHSASAGK